MVKGKEEEEEEEEGLGAANCFFCTGWLLELGTHIFQLNNIPKYFSPKRPGGKAGLAMLNQLFIHVAVPFYHSGIFLMIILGGFLFDYFVSCFVFFFLGPFLKFRL